MIKISKEDLFRAFAPAFNFEYDMDQLLELALKRGFVAKIEGEDNLFLINEEY